ncbi:MAG: hypothetical protein IPL61_37000 [Myxococcales bacterium]|nr:hypothetical protein [Myxococcales bacterium]
MKLRSSLMGSGLALALALAACGSKGKDDGGGGGAAKGAASCDSPKVKECTEYGPANRAAAGDEYLEKLCVGLEGAFAKTPCPAAARLGACAKREGTKVFYQDYGMTAAQLAESCTAGDGTWRAP